MKKLLILIIFCFWAMAIAGAENSVLRLSFVGDIMAHDVNFANKNFTPVYAAVKELLLNDDLTIGNLEFPVNEKIPYATYPQFNVHREYVQAVIDAGLDMFALANNHSYDRGTEGVYQTLVSMIMLKEAFEGKILFSGLRGNPKQPFKPVSTEKKGMRIGFIAVTAISNIYPKESILNIVNYGNEASAQAFLDFIKTTAPRYDLFIVSYHAGGEYQLTPPESKAVFFRKIIEAGAHIVYGHHPHVLQPVEVMKINGLNRLIIHSAGNFISGQRWFSYPIDINNYRSYTGDSAIFKVQAELKPEGVDVTGVELELITNHIDQNRQVVVKPFKDILNQPLAANWHKYYEERYKLMQKFIPNKDIIR